MRTILRIVAAFGMAAATLSTTAAQEPLNLTVGYDGFTMTTTPMLYAQEKGLFEKYGLDVELQYVEGGSVLTQALVGGSVDIAQNGYAPAISAAVAGADIVVIGGISNTLPMMLVVDASIEDAEDLRGQSIAISRYGSSTDVAARVAVESLGLTTSDVNVLQLGGEGSRIAAFSSGQVGGIIAQHPGAQDLVDGGARILVDVGQTAATYPNTGYMTTRAFLEEEDSKEAIKRFYMAMAEGLRAYRDDPDGATAVTATFLQSEASPNLRGAVEYYSERVFQMDLRPTEPGMQAVLEELAKTVPAAASIDPADLIDTSTLDQLEQEGFFESLDP